MNSKHYSWEEAKKGMLNDLIDFLRKQSEQSRTYFNDIHILFDDYGPCVEWIDRPYDSDSAVFTGEFRFVDEDQVVLYERTLPDNSVIYVYDEEEYQNDLNEFLKEDPDWDKNEFGNWYRPSEQKAWEEEIKKSKESKENI